MAQFRFIALSLFSVASLVACADAETDGLGGSPSQGGNADGGAPTQGGNPSQGGDPSQGGAPGNTVTNNTVTNNTVANGTVTVSNGQTTTTGGGPCDPIACFTMCIPDIGTCNGNVCECGGFPSGSSGSGFGGGFGFGGAFP